MSSKKMKCPKCKSENIDYNCDYLNGHLLLEEHMDCHNCGFWSEYAYGEYRDSDDLEEEKKKMNNKKMQLLIKDRGTGKTTRLLYASEVTGYPIVVSSRNRVNLLLDQADKLGVVIPEPLTFNEVKQYERCGMPENILIDEVYEIIGEALDYYMGAHVAGATMTDVRKEIKHIRRPVGKGKW